MPERNAVDYGSAPVMPKQYDSWRIKVFGKQIYVIGGALECVEFEGAGRCRSVVAHHVWDDDTEVEGKQERDLVAPAEGKVGPAVNEEDGGSRRGRGGCEEIVV